MSRSLSVEHRNTSDKGAQRLRHPKVHSRKTGTAAHLTPIEILAIMTELMLEPARNISPKSFRNYVKQVGKAFLYLKRVGLNNEEKR